MYELHHNLLSQMLNGTGIFPYIYPAKLPKFRYNTAYIFRIWDTLLCAFYSNACNLSKFYVPLIFQFPIYLEILEPGVESSYLIYWLAWELGSKYIPKDPITFSDDDWGV